MTPEKLTNMELLSIKISNYITNQIQNCQTTAGFGETPLIELTKNSQNPFSNLKQAETTLAKNLIM